MPERSAARLWLYGLGMLLPTLYFARRYPLRPNIGRLVDLGRLSDYGRGEFVAFVIAFALLFSFYGLALREAGRLRPERALRTVFGCAAALGASMAALYPATAIDMYIYAVHARLYTVYGVNPSAAFPKDYPKDAWLGYASRQWAQYESPYGPLWNLLAAPGAALAGDRIAVAIAGFKLLAVISFLLCGWLIARALNLSDRARAAQGALFFLWNPLVLWEGVGNGHNDLVMLLPVLLALYAYARRWDQAVLPLLLAAALIKYVPAILLPLAAAALWRRAASGRARLRLVGWSGVLCALVAAVAFYPFYDLAAVRDSIAHHSAIYRMSPATLLRSLLADRYGAREVRQAAQIAGVIVALLVLGWQSARVWRQPERLPRAAFEVVFVFLLVARWNFTAWYLIWPVGLAALLPLGWPAWRVTAWSAGALAHYALLIWVAAWWKPGFDTLQNTGVLLIFSPPLLVLGAELTTAAWSRTPVRARRTSGADLATNTDNAGA